MKKSDKRLKIAELGNSKNSKNAGLSLKPRVRNKIHRLFKLLREQDTKCWAIGDMCIDLLDNDKLSLGQIANLTNYSKTRISHYHLTARMFTENQRQGYTFQDSLTARQVFHSLPRLNMTPVQIRNEIVKMRNKTTKQVRSYFVHLLMKREMDQSLSKSAKTHLSKKGNLINACHHSDWRIIVPKLPSNSVNLWICDPVFGYSKEFIEGNYLSFI